jgi:hypothetical protein
MKYRHTLSRRTVLRGACGIAIGLPLLEEMLPESAWGAPPVPPVRAFNVFLGGGVPAIFQQAGLVGPLTPLAPLASKMAFVRGIQGPGGHPAGAANAFVGKNAINLTTMGGPSIDNEIMRFAYPSGTAPTPVPVQAAGYYYKFLDDPSRWVKSWNAQGQPSCGLVTDPKVLFSTLFGQAPGGMTAAAGIPAMAPQMTADQKLETSILDTVVSQYQFYTSSASNLSAGSQAKIADHLDAIRQLENQAAGVSLVTQSGSGKLSVCATPTAPPAGTYASVSHDGAGGGPATLASDFVSGFKVMADVYAMGVACDLYRFGYTVCCCAGDGLVFTGPYTVAGQPVNLSMNTTDTHSTNHEMGDDPTGGGQPLTYAGWYTHLFLECCASVMQALDSYMEPNGQSILANSFVLFGTDLGTNHNGASVFYGMSQAGGKFKPGIYDVTGQLLDFLTSCKVGMGLPGTATMTSFIA